MEVLVPFIKNKYILPPKLVYAVPPDIKLLVLVIEHKCQTN